SEFVGGYDDWLRQRSEDTVMPASIKSKNPMQTEVKEKSQKKKLSYKDQRDLDELPTKIEQLETEVESLHAKMADADFFLQDKDEIVKVQDLLKETEQTLATCYRRWEELEV
ncbi:MAG: ABC transporter ATP-binding protein, partial [Gammaproteobacteria bacterium]